MFIRRLLKRISHPRGFFSLVSLSFVILSYFLIILIWIERFRDINLHGPTLEDQILIVSIPIITVFFFQAFLQAIYGIIYQEKSLVSGSDVSTTRYNYKHMIDRYAKEIILVSQNFRGAINSAFKEKAKELIDRGGRVILVGTTRRAMAEICKGDDRAVRHFLSSLSDIKEVYLSVKEVNRCNLYVQFHPSASSLTAFFRDPFHHSKNRNILIIGPKFAQDKNKQDRLYCVIENWEYPDLFHQFRDHLYFMIDPQNNPQTLYDFCEEFRSNYFEGLTLEEKRLLDWFIETPEFTKRPYMIFNET